MRSYAIGDIHGQLDLLRDAHARIAADRRLTGDSTAPVVHLGDLVDRGPDSCGVIDYLRAGPANWIVLRGNHDSMFARFLADPGDHDPALRRDLSWLHPRLGGLATLQSYGIDASEADAPADLHAAAIARVPAAHAVYLRNLPLSLERGEALFVHAGIRPGIPLDQQSATDLMWIRDSFHVDRRDHGPLILHGHTPVDRVSHYGNRVNLDTGAAYGGPLTAVVIEGRDVWDLTKAGRKLLLPHDRL